MLNISSLFAFGLAYIRLLRRLPMYRLNIYIQFDEATGKIATCSNTNIYVYKPYGQDEGAVKVGGSLHTLMAHP